MSVTRLSQVDAATRPDPRPAVALRLRELAVALGTAAGRVRAGGDPEAIHDLRVAARRLSAALGLWETGALKPLVGAELPLEEIERAHELVESRQSVGKVVLLP